MPKEKVIETCTQCGEECVLGVNAIIEHKQVHCDKCSGTVRGLGGFAFSPEPQCIGTDPLRCDDLNCPVHGRV